MGLSIAVVVMGLAVSTNTSGVELTGEAPEHPLTLWYRQPATEWEETLPSAWPDGNVSGLRARGGFDVDSDWKDCKLATATVLSRPGNSCRIRSTAPVTVQYERKTVQTKSSEDGVIVFETKAGQSYTLSAHTD